MHLFSLLFLLPPFLTPSHPPQVCVRQIPAAQTPMSNHFLGNLRRRFQSHTSAGRTRKRKQNGYRRSLAYESLETRQLLAVAPLQNLSVSENTGEKPQSKIWEHAGQWWTVMPNSSGTWVVRLDGNSWTPTQQISTNKSVHADVKSVGNLAHVLLFDDDTSTQLATLQYDGGPDNRFEPWSLRPQLVNVPLGSSVETATIDVDSTGRMWVAYDRSSTIEVRYSDGLYNTWSAPITVASGINSDDISTVIAMPGNKIGVLWSNQSTKQFGFRVHQDGAAPDAWGANEVPASQWVQSVGGAFADDHVHTAVASDGTLYAAVKTSYDSSGKPKLGMLVRRPNGVWDNFYEVDTKGTRPIVVLNEAAGRLIFAYTTSDSGGNILYRESSMGTISFSASKTLISGSLNNVTSTKQNFTDNVVFMAGGGSSAKSVLFSFDTPPTATNQAPVVNAGPNQSIAFNGIASLNGTVTDDSRPTPVTLGHTWTKVSGPGTVTFGNAQAIDTTASFSAAGTYVLQLTASDGQLTAWDQVTINVAAPATAENQAPTVNAGADQSVAFGTTVTLTGSVTDDGLPAANLLGHTWSKKSGLGTVSFGNTQSATTSVTFSLAGTYVLQLTASDSQLIAWDEVTINVGSTNPDPPTNDPIAIAFQDGLFPSVAYAGTRDTKLNSGSKSKNYGTAQSIDIDGSPDVAGLFKWDISSIPTGSVIVSAAIELNVTNTSSDTYNAYALQRAWDELSATWQQFAAGQNWATAGANSSTDHGTAALGTFAASSKGISRITLNSAGIAAVQAWVNNPAANFGIILQDYTKSSGVDVSTSEAATASQRPKLIINYTPAATVAALAFGSSSNAPLLVDVGPNITVQRGTTVALSSTISDEGVPISPELVTLLWAQMSGPSTATIANSTAASTTAQFDTVGSYVLRLTVDDGGWSSFDELTITVI